MDSKDRKFSSPQEEVEYWKRLAHEYRDSAEECKEEYDEFQLNSKELEAELEVQLSQAESKNKELRTANSHLQMEVENLRERLEQQQSQSHTRITNLEDDLAKVTCYKDELEKYIRQLEQANDDLERAKRSTVVSLEDFEGKLNHALERNAFLEGELDEKENLAFAVQRLKDEARDLRQELAVVKKSESQPQFNVGPNAEEPSSPLSKSNSDVQKIVDMPPVSNGIDSNKLEEGVQFTIGSQSLPASVTQTPKGVLLNQTGKNGTPLTPSARISALNIVGDLLRKVGALESKLASCRNFVNSQPARSGQKAAASSPLQSPRQQRPRSLGLTSYRCPNLHRAKRVHRAAAPTATAQAASIAQQPPNLVKLTI